MAHVYVVRDPPGNALFSRCTAAVARMGFLPWPAEVAYSQDMMLAALFATNWRALDTGLLLLRLALAVVLFPHGAQKLLGWFGGYGFAGTMHVFTGMMHIPAPLGALVILVEFFAPLLLVIGVLTRVAAIAIGVDMLVAVLTVHLANGFFANWSGHQKGEGVEYFIYAIVVAAVVTIIGAGNYSIDARIAGGNESPGLHAAS